MSTIEEIKAAIEKLPVSESGRLRRWLLARDSRDWDRQIEKDAKAGRLDGLAGEALAEFGI